MEYIYNIDVSLSGESRFEYVPAVQGDIKSRYLKITLYADSQIFIVPDNVIAILRCKRRDGLIILSKCTLNNDGSLIAMLTNQMLAKAGDLKCEIALYDSTDNSRLTSTAFTVKVHAALTSETQIPDDDNDDDVENKEGLIAFYEKGGTLPAGEPKNDNHVTTKKYVDDKLDGKLNKVTSDVRIYPGVYATSDTDGTPHLITATSDLSYIGTGSGYIPLYEAGGQLKTAEPTADDSAANKGYVDKSTDALKIHGKKIGSVVRIDDAFDAEYAKVSCTASVKKYGRNLLPYPYTDTTKTANGITFTDNGDGSVTANGTATADTGFMCQNFLNVSLPKGDYTASGAPSGGSLTYYINFAFKHNSATAYDSSDYGNGLHFSLPDGADKIYIFIRVKSGNTLNNVIFKPQLEFGGVATEYEPYKAPVIYQPNASGKVDIPLYSVATTLMADGAIITANYTRNTTDVISKMEENSNPYKLIETITLTEATQIIERSREPNGTAYGFAKVLITVDTPKTDTAAQQNIRLYINDGTLDYYAYYQSLTTYAKRAHFDCVVDNGVLKIRIGNGATNYGGENTGVAAMIENANIVFLSAINKIKLKGEATFAVGTVIKIYGVRA